MSEKTDRAVQARHLQEILVARLAKGREWATPGVESALRRALGRIEAGIDVASPQLQATLRAMADELAGGVETLTPRLHERIARIIPEAEAPVPDKATRGILTKKPWLVAAAAVTAIVAGISLWSVLRTGQTSEVKDEAAPKAQPVQGEPVPNTLPDSP
ncbi:hypothetical protein [Arthrobacter sp. ZGTC131]|uniref:hypothetical protein n=1 Tax=Arthrobacter sp. ZGTC131 TaxID=2058898 RepID=UPI000CE5608A|nr:hypothetical protein [Arthrobacter sp. ZGTC131]